MSSSFGKPKTSKLQELFLVSSCYNGSYGRSTNGGKTNGRRVIRTSSYGAYGDPDDDDDDGGGGGRDGGGGGDDGDDHDDVVVAAAAATGVAFGRSNGTRRSDVGRKIGSTTSNSDSGRSSTEIGPEADRDKELSQQQNGQRSSASSDAVAGNGRVKDLV